MASRKAGEEVGSFDDPMIEDEFATNVKYVAQEYASATRGWRQETHSSNQHVDREDEADTKAIDDQG